MNRKMFSKRDHTKKDPMSRSTYAKPTTCVVACAQCLMQNFSRVNPGQGPDLKPEEGTPEDPKLAKRNNMWEFDTWSNYDEN